MGLYVVDALNSNMKNQLDTNLHAEAATIKATLLPFAITMTRKQLFERIKRPLKV
jgi:hypothetical protein